MGKGQQRFLPHTQTECKRIPVYFVCSWLLLVNFCRMDRVNKWEILPRETRVVQLRDLSGKKLVGFPKQTSNMKAEVKSL